MPTYPVYTGQNVTKNEVCTMPVVSKLDPNQTDLTKKEYYDCVKDISTGESHNLNKCCYSTRANVDTEIGTCCVDPRLISEKQCRSDSLITSPRGGWSTGPPILLNNKPGEYWRIKDPQWDSKNKICLLPGMTAKACRSIQGIDDVITDPVSYRKNFRWNDTVNQANCLQTPVCNTDEGIEFGDVPPLSIRSSYDSICKFIGKSGQIDCGDCCELVRNPPGHGFSCIKVDNSGDCAFKSCANVH